MKTPPSEASYDATDSPASTEDEGLATSGAESTHTDDAVAGADSVNPSADVSRPQALAASIVSIAEPPIGKREARRRRKEARRQQKAALEERRKVNAKQSLVPFLTVDELCERLCLNSTALVGEVHAIALRQIESEDKRETRLDGKAQGLLVTASLSLTVAFTFGGLLLQHPEYVSELGLWPVLILVAAYSAALFVGLLSSVTAVRALYVTDSYRSVGERDALADQGLARANDECLVPLGTGDAARDNAKALAHYQRYMAVHYWQIWQQHSMIHKAKARMIKRGQRLFIAFLVLMMLIGGAMASAAVVRAKTPHSSRNSP